MEHRRIGGTELCHFGEQTSASCAVKRVIWFVSASGSILLNKTLEFFYKLDYHLRKATPNFTKLTTAAPIPHNFMIILQVGSLQSESWADAKKQASRSLSSRFCAQNGFISRTYIQRRCNSWQNHQDFVHNTDSHAQHGKDQVSIAIRCEKDKFPFATTLVIIDQFSVYVL